MNLKRHIPNMFTAFRIVLTFLLCANLLHNNPSWHTILYIIFIYFTDIIDGKLARRWNVVSNVGKWGDIIADGMFVFLIIGICIHLSMLPLYLIFLIGVHYIFFLSTIKLTQRYKMTLFDKYGKFAGIYSYLLPGIIICLKILHLDFHLLHDILVMVCFFLTICGVIGRINYIGKYIRRAK